MRALTDTVPAIDTAGWVNRLSTVLLTLMLLYALVGLPEFNRDITAMTDYVNPFNRIVWLGLLAVAAPIAVARRREVLILMRASWALLLLHAFFAISVTWALDPEAATRRILFATVQLVLSMVLLSGLKRAATLHLLIAGVCAFAMLEDLAAWVLWPGYAMTDEGFAGMQLQKNVTGLLMMYGLLSTSTAFFLLRTRLARLVVVGTMLLMAGVLVATRSTTSQSIVLLSPVVIPFILFVSRQPRSTIWAVVAAIPALLLMLAFVYLAYCGIANADPWLPLRDVTFTARTDLWKFTLQEIAKRPWLGAGYSSFWAINPAIQPSLKSDMWFGVDVIINEAHDGYLDLLATGGVVGLVGGLFVVFRTLGIAGRAIVYAEPTAAAEHTGRLALPTAVFHFTLLVGLLVHNFTESNLFSNTSPLAVALILATLDLEKWRLATKRAAGPRYPNPRPYRPLAAPIPTLP